MIIKKDLSQQLPKTLLNAFSQLKIGHHLRKAGIIKGVGYSCLELFQLVFLLVFQHKNWFRLLESEQRTDLPGKDTIYRFLNDPRYNWRAFLHSLSGTFIKTLGSLTSAKRVRVFIIDDSVYSRSRSRALELLARVHDHTTGKFVKGFQMLTLGWSDGFTFVPVGFTLLSSRNEANRLQNIREDIDKRTNGYKRRKEALQSKPAAVLTLLDHALQMGIQADYVLMDTWFTHSPLIQAISGRGLQVIGMVKQLKQRYLFGQQMLTLGELFTLCRTQRTKHGILGSIVVRLACGLQVKLVFIQNRNKRSEWLTLLSTDCSLDAAEIVRIYGKRWQIETFFKFTKSYLNLAKEFQGRSYDMLISHTTIVFTRYILLAWEARQKADSKTLGGLFYLLCDEVKDIDVKTALVQLWAFMQRHLENSS
ncbi:transposase, partial [Brevibacillus agri]